MKSTSPKPELPPLPDVANLAKLLGEHERLGAEIVKHERLVAEKREIEKELTLHADLQNPDDFRQLSETRLFIEVCNNKLPTFAQRQAALEPQIEKAGEPVRMGLLGFARWVGELEKRIIDRLLAGFVDAKHEREALVDGAAYRSRLTRRLASITDPVSPADLSNRPAYAARRLLAARAATRAEIPVILKHLSQKGAQ